uniref:Patatin-like phospholipase domain-containing protein 2 n=1 Tax=Astyanax mexicanus TaxID=7994 RepID=A0A3B1IGK4_ASTMX
MVPPSYKGVHYMDGGLTNIQPTQDSCPTLTVSPFSGDVDICPSDASSSSFCDLVVNRMSVHATLPNFVRVANALFPRDRRALNKAFYSGYQDTLYFLQHSRWVWPYPGWVSELERVVVKPEEWMFPQLEEQEVEAEELVLESPLEVVTENSRAVNMEPPNNQNLLNPSSNINPPRQALEVLICNLVANLGMISILSVYLPQRSLPYLLLPLSIIIWATTSFTSRVEPWVLSLYQVVYWIWQDTKHMMWFILGIIVSTVQRAIQHKMLMLFLDRTKDFGMEKSQLSISPSFRHNPSIPPSLHALLFTLEMRRRQRESRQNVP